jgi:hypothetical protein
MGGAWSGLCRRMRKTVLRLLSGRGELERLLHGCPSSAAEGSGGSGDSCDAPAAASYARAALSEFEACLSSSASLRASGLALRALAGGADARDARLLAADLCRAKRVSPRRPGFASRTQPALLALLALCRARAALEARAGALAGVAVAGAPPLLLGAWARVFAGGPPPAASGAHWGALGFQGKDPATDFRGTGALGLHALAHLAARYAAAVRAIADATDLPARGYPLAVAHIAVTAFALDLLRSRRLGAPALAPAGGGLVAAAGERAPPGADAAAAAAAAGRADGDAPLPAAAGADADAPDAPLLPFFETCAVLLLTLDDVWADERAANVMDFPRVFAAFKARVDAAAAGGAQLPLPRRIADAGMTLDAPRLPIVPRALARAGATAAAAAAAAPRRHSARADEKSQLTPLRAAAGARRRGGGGGDADVYGTFAAADARSELSAGLLDGDDAR